jgi:hypothetical protein
VGKELEAASAKETTPRIVAAMIASGETRLEGSMGAAQTEDEKGQIQQEPGPSGGCGGHAEVKIEARKRATKDPTANHLLSDNRESEDNSEVAGSHGLTVRPKKKGKFSQKSAGGETGERRVLPAVQASVDGMGNDGGESNYAPLSLDSDNKLEGCRKKVKVMQLMSSSDVTGRLCVARVVARGLLAEVWYDEDIVEWSVLNVM